MNTPTTLMLLAALTGCAYQPATTQATQYTPCQEQLRQQRVFMMITTVELNACLAKPSNQCLTAVANMRARQEGVDFNPQRVQACMQELKRTNESDLIAFVNENSAFQVTLGETKKLFERAAKRGRF